MTLLEEIMQQAAGNVPLQKALVAGAEMEGGSLTGPWPPGDEGWSRGPYQIKTWQPWREGWKGHPLSIDEAENPAAAVAYAIKYDACTLPDGRAAMCGLGYRMHSQGHPDPIEVAYRSEHPAAYYSTDQQARARAVLAEVFGEGQKMVPKPEIVFVGCHDTNYRKGREPLGLEVIGIHTTAGGSSIEALDSWFNTRVGVNGKTAGSTNFGVGPDGRIHQYVALSDTPIANGARASATARLVQENAGLDANAYSISIEHLDGGVPGTVTETQFEASAHLTAWLFQEVLSKSSARPVPTVDRDHILGHYQFDPEQRAFCPSWPEERFTRYIARVNEWLTAAAPVPEPEPEPVTLEGVKLGLVEKVLREAWTDLTLDAARLAGLTVQ